MTRDTARRRWTNTPRIVIPLVAILVAVLAVLVGVPVLLVVSSQWCTPPSEAQFARQRSFVLDHLPDARKVESGHADCDDRGRGYVEFVTGLTPTEAAGRFLDDSSCSVASGSDGGDAAVHCRSDGVLVLITFDAAQRGSDGYLDMPPL